LSVHQVTGLGAWASAGASRMPALVEILPNYIEAITLIVDDDDAGWRHAYQLAERLDQRGIEVILSGGHTS
jgi:DNA primase